MTLWNTFTNGLYHLFGVFREDSESFPQTIHREVHIDEVMVNQQVSVVASHSHLSSKNTLQMTQLRFGALPNAEVSCRVGKGSLTFAIQNHGSHPMRNVRFDVMITFDNYSSRASITKVTITYKEVQLIS